MKTLLYEIFLFVLVLSLFYFGTMMFSDGWDVEDNMRTFYFTKYMPNVVCKGLGVFVIILSTTLPLRYKFRKFTKNFILRRVKKKAFY